MRKLDRIARAICQAHHNDPDVLAYPPMMHRFAVNNTNILIPPTEDFLQPRPMWVWYLPQAEAAVRAMEGMFPFGGAWGGCLRQILSEKEVGADGDGRRTEENGVSG